MAYTNTFKKDETGQFSRVFPPTLNQGQSFTDPTGRTGTVQFNTETGERLLPGQTTPTQPTRTLPSPTPQPSPYAYGRPPNDQLNEFNTATGQRNPNFSPPQAPTATAPTTTDPYTAFNMLLQESLKSAQKIDTSELLKRQKELQLERIKRSRGEGIVSLTPEQLKFASPESQASMRNAWVGALNPEITETQFQITRLDDERKNAIEQIMLARDAGDKAREFEAEQKWKQTTADLEKEKFAETQRLNKETERIAGIKANTEAGANGQSPYQEERQYRTIQSVNELLDQVSGNTVGWGAFFKRLIPESEARYFEGQISTLKSSIITTELTAMREASKTGGALGQISDRESKYLSDALGALDTLVTPEQFKTQLNKIKASIERWQTAVNKNSGKTGDIISSEDPLGIR